MSYVDQSEVFAFDESELPPSNQIAEEPWRSFYNEIGPSAEPTLQLSDILDFTEAEEMELAEFFDEEVGGELAALDAEMAETAADVPYEWRYWEHSANEFPAPDESVQPPMESGWVDPDTDELVP